MLAGPGDPPLFNQSTWIDRTCTITDNVTGEERLYTTFVCPPKSGPDKLYGLARWNDTLGAFSPVRGTNFQVGSVAAVAAVGGKKLPLL